MRTITYDENEWVLVPRVPTREMLDAYLANSARFSSARSDWYVMLAAAPDHPATAGDAEDAARLDWFFDDTGKPADFIDSYLQGIREHWTPDQWRSAIDAAMRASKETT